MLLKVFQISALAHFLEVTSAVKYRFVPAISSQTRDIAADTRDESRIKKKEPIEGEVSEKSVEKTEEDITDLVDFLCGAGQDWRGQEEVGPRITHSGGAERDVKSRLTEGSASTINPEKSGQEVKKSPAEALNNTEDARIRGNHLLDHDKTERGDAFGMDKHLEHAGADDDSLSEHLENYEDLYLSGVDKSHDYGTADVTVSQHPDVTTETDTAQKSSDECWSEAKAKKLTGERLREHLAKATIMRRKGVSLITMIITTTMSSAVG